MFTYIKKKIIQITDKTISFFKDNLAQIIFLFVLLQVLLALREAPYFNLINNFEFYSIGLFLFLSMIVFRVIIPYERIMQMVLVLFVAAAIFTILGQTAVSKLIGFVSFVLISLIVGRQILRQRKDLKNIDNDL